MLCSTALTELRKEPVKFQFAFHGQGRCGKMDTNRNGYYYAQINITKSSPTSKSRRKNAEMNEFQLFEQNDGRNARSFQMARKSNCKVGTRLPGVMDGRIFMSFYCHLIVYDLWSRIGSLCLNENFRSPTETKAWRLDIRGNKIESAKIGKKVLGHTEVVQ